MRVYGPSLIFLYVDLSLFAGAPPSMKGGFLADTPDQPSEHLATVAAKYLSMCPLFHLYRGLPGQ